MLSRDLGFQGWLEFLSRVFRGWACWIQKVGFDDVIVILLVIVVIILIIFILTQLVTINK